MEDAFVRFADVTAIVGPNDGGKSRLLEDIVSAIDGAMLATAARQLAPSAVVYAELSEAELKRVLAIRRASLSHAATEIAHLVDPDPSTVRRRVWPSDLPALSDPLRASLAATRIVAFSRGTQTYWRTWLCLPAVPDVPDDRVALERLGDVAPRALYELAKSSAGDIPAALLHPSAPMAVIELGGVGDGAMPEPVRVPTTSRSLIDDLASAVDQLLENVAWARSAADELDFSGADRWHPEEFENAQSDIDESRRAWLSTPRSRRDLWFEFGDHGRVMRRRRELDKIAARASRIATGTLPDFLAERYAIRIRPASAGEWTEGAPADIRLHPRDGSTAFGLDDAADGVRLWVQLSVLEAIRDLRRWPTLVEAVIQRLRGDVEWVVDTSTTVGQLEAKLEDLDAADTAYFELEGDLALASEDLYEARRAAASFGPVFASALSDAFKLPRVGRAVQPLASLDRSRSFRSPLYVLDEPERHLHARLQRAAASWLEGLAQTHDVQVALVTHSVPFMRLSQQAHNFVHRVEGGSNVENLVPEQLDSLNEITRELGLDRGELLASVSLLLFVEGESDRIVLETLYGDRLRSAGIAVMPMGGITRSAAVLDAEMLLRWSSASLCVMFDDLGGRELETLLALTDEQLRRASRKGKAERQYMARLIGEARRLGRQIHVAGIPVHDIFDLLDDSALRAVFPTWPGHVRARLEYERGATEMHVKDFREARYGIQKHEVYWYGVVADHMRARPPRELERVLRKVERHALDARL